MRRFLFPLTLLLPALLPSQTPTTRSAAMAVLDRAMTRMGGEAALQSVKSIRLDMMTQWQRINFSEAPFTDQPSYERNVELRDYTTRSWRNTRQFIGAGPALSIVDIVRDTVAARYTPVPAGGGAWAALNVAYVDERQELFTFAPERMLLLAKASPSLRRLADTAIGTVSYRRLRATIEGRDATMSFRESDGLPAMVRFRADETNDFGLAPWADHEIEFWYNGWQWMTPGVLLPRQRDVRRVGRTYKRMTLLSATVNAPVPADSFPLTDSLRVSYFATQHHAMWNVPLDSARLVQPHLASFPPFLGMAGAIRIGGQWVLLEGGQAAGAAALAGAWLKQTTPDTPIGAALLTWPSVGNGGVRWMAEQHLPLYVAPGAMPFVRRMLGARTAAATPVTTARWIRVGTDSLWLEPLQIPEANGALAVYSPTYRWLYIAPGSNANLKFELDAMIARLTARGMPVEFLGSGRVLSTPRT